MRPSVINNSILSEIIPSFLVNLLIFSFVLLMARFMSLTDLVLNKGVGTEVVLRIFVLILPRMLDYSVPMATLLACLTTFLRMSADSELTVLKSSGLSLYQLLPPVAIFGLVAALLTALFNLYVTPAANTKFRIELLTLAKARADLAIKEQVFVRDFPGLTIYVGQLPTSTNETMSNVLINDRRSTFENSIIVARAGILDVDAASNLLLFRLFDGVIDRFYTEKSSVDSIFFDVYELKISPGPEFATGTVSGPGRRQDLPTGRLLAEADRLARINFPYPQIFRMEYHRRFSLPLACFLMAIIGMPLGASFTSKGRNFGLAIGLAIFVAYYFLFTLGWTLGETTYVSPAKSIWSPIVVVALAAVWLLSGINKSSPLDLKVTLSHFKEFFSRLTRWKGGARRAPR
ncbi:MAG: LptF/LptG family permease [Deltaproteobacteria bacterium]|jgi:lipopolysaccharide export system permease protein|nr:LptF/LptG family permease [Deltaproteobacteria bacterium]